MGLFRNDLIEKSLQGDNEAQYQLGIQYCIKDDPRNAYVCLRTAANQGHTKAKEFLGDLIRRGLLRSYHEISKEEGQKYL